MKINKPIDLRKLIDENLSTKEMFQFYLGTNCLNNAFNSPFRKDKNPSCNIYLSKNGNYRYKDFGNGDNFSIYDIISKIYNIDYIDVLDKICQDFKLKPNNYKQYLIKNQDYIDSKNNSVKKSVKIKFQSKKFTENDLKYWNEYGILNIETLQKFNVFSVNKIWINNEKINKLENELCFAYYFPISDKVKLLFPSREKKKKWLSNVSNDTDIQGYYQCAIKTTKPNLLILTKSMKECMFFYERGIYAMAINGENHHFNPLFIDHLKRHCKNIISFYDNDNSGIKGAIDLKKKYDIDYFHISKDICTTINIKDITDMYKFFSKEEAEKIVNKLKTRH